MTRAGQTVVTAFSLHPDVVRRLDRMAKHLGLSRSACAGQILSCGTPLLDDVLPLGAEILVLDKESPDA